MRTLVPSTGADSHSISARRGFSLDWQSTSDKGGTVIKIFLVADHEFVRKGVAGLLDTDPELTVIGEAGSAAQALARIPALRPDLVLLDVRLPDGNGVELCRELRSKLPELNVLMLTSFTDEEAMLNAILAGAGGYVIKDIQADRLVSAVREVGAGRALRSEERRVGKRGR